MCWIRPLQEYVIDRVGRRAIVPRTPPPAQDEAAAAAVRLTAGDRHRNDTAQVVLARVRRIAFLYHDKTAMPRGESREQGR